MWFVLLALNFRSTLCFSFYLPLHLLSSSYMNPEAPRPINFYFFSDEREGKRDRKKDKSSPVSASLFLPFCVSMQVWSHFQAEPGVFQTYKLDFPSAQQWVSLPSSSTCQLSSPFSSFLPASLPSKMTQSQERSRFFQLLVSSLTCIALCTAETLPSSYELQLEFSLCVHVGTHVRVYPAPDSCCCCWE